MTVREWLEDAEKTLSVAGISSARLDSVLLIEKVLKTDRTKILADPLRSISETELDRLSKLLKSRELRVPLAYLVGHREFYGREFKLNRKVLIPRPETELIVEWTVKHAPENAEILDIGTGAGPIAISIALERNDTTVTASDISDEALKVAKRNAKSLEAGVKFVKSDIFKDISGQFDVITANLPYVPLRHNVNEEVTKEPKQAVYSGKDGLDHYRKLAQELDHHKKHGSFIVVEHLPEQAGDIIEIFKQVATDTVKIGPFTTVITV